MVGLHVKMADNAKWRGGKNSNLKIAGNSNFDKIVL